MNPMRTLLAIAVFSFSLSAWAQRVTVMDLEGDLIEGASDRPDVEPITATPERPHESLIRVRQDFRAEAMQSAGAL